MEEFNQNSSVVNDQNVTLINVVYIHYKHLSQTLKQGTNLEGDSQKDADCRSQKVMRSICIHVKKSETKKIATAIL